MANNKKIPGKAFDGHLSLPLPIIPIPKKEKNSPPELSNKKEKGQKGGKEKPKKG